ncbi:alpha/beta hydrolase-fold protein [Pasteurella sp. PK-2025]|uniref:alpha/beta hydrolase-fold protein n=1 Tax=Pasteurella sp. PK-2025 TaxID=3413133 RepID=UPI003C77441A
MKPITAYFLPFFYSAALLAEPIAEISLAQEDFVKGELRLLNNQDNSARLTIQFPDQTQRVLLEHVYDKQEFMFTSPSQGMGKFILEGEKQPLRKQDVTLQILQHFPIQQQTSPLVYENQRLQQLHLALTKLSQNAPHFASLATPPAELSQSVATLLDTFWTEVEKQGTPLIEPIDDQFSRVTFLWRGAKHNVRIFGGPSQDHDFMEKMPSTDIWFKSYRMPNETHVSYRLAPDVPTLPVSAVEQRRAILATAQADPFNRYPYFPAAQQPLHPLDKFHYASQLILPNAPTQRYLTPTAGEKGQLTTFIFESQLLANKRRVFVYTPAHFQPQNAYPVLYVFDGVEYTEQVPVPTILDNMIAEKVIPPVVAVFIENPSMQTRAQELPPNPKFAQAITQELLPFVEKQIPLQVKQRIIAGSSYGGLASAYLSLHSPQLFQRALILSGSFWWHPKGTPSSESHFIAHQFAQREKLPLCFFISAGYFERGRSEILQTSRHLKDVLMAKGYQVDYREYATAHGYLAWQGIISEGLTSLLTDCKN